jgi:tRNA A37 threonylcarbamoyladenosine biosynthesis protein TsaE
MKYNIQEIKDVLTYIINNNKELAAQGKKAVAVSLSGDAGIGKTESVIGLAKDLGVFCQVVRLSQMEEVGD